MQYIKNTVKHENEIEAEVFFQTFNQYLSLVVELNDIDYAEKCAYYLNNLPLDILNKLCSAAIQYCNAHLESMGDPQKAFENPQDILKSIYPSSITFARPQDDEVTIVLEAECDWEPEHGLELIIRNNKLLYIGPFHGRNPLGEFPETDEWNFAN